MPHTGLARSWRFSGELDLVLYAGLVSQGPWSSAAPPPSLPSITEVKMVHRQMKTSDLSSLGKGPHHELGEVVCSKSPVKLPTPKGSGGFMSCADPMGGEEATPGSYDWLGF